VGDERKWGCAKTDFLIDGYQEEAMKKDPLLVSLDPGSFDRIHQRCTRIGVPVMYVGVITCRLAPENF
jgi:hypothetical protein